MMNLTTGWLLLSAAFSVALANFYFATAPEEMKFHSGVDGESLRRSEIPYVVNFLMALPAQYQHKTESWTGMEKVDIFNPPQANLLITVHVPSLDSFSLSRYVKKYTTVAGQSGVSPVLELNRAIVAQYKDVDLIKSFMLESQYRDNSVGMVDTQKIRESLDGDESVLETLPVGSVAALNKDIDPDVYLIGELQMIKDILHDMRPSEKYYARQSFHVVLTSVDRLVRRYGVESKQVKEAIALLQYYIPQFIDAANAKFRGNLLCEVDVTEDTPEVLEYLVRHSRNLLQSEPATEGLSAAPNASSLNLAEPVSADFAVVFNIVLWLMVGFFLAVVAATYFMWFMDPGKDNIIYRVTSQRMKSD